MEVVMASTIEVASVPLLVGLLLMPAAMYRRKGRNQCP